MNERQNDWVAGSRLLHYLIFLRYNNYEFFESEIQHKMCVKQVWFGRVLVAF